MKEDILYFASDYMEAMHPDILKRLNETNMQKSPGYGEDTFSKLAKEKIRTACNCSDAAVYFFVGGTQTNAVAISSSLRSYEGVIAADSGHISVHEAGAVELRGHKVLTLPGKDGKLIPEQIVSYVDTFNNDGSKTHMVFPRMVYISQPTEFGTLYSIEELKKISDICKKNDLILYADGARLAYALACEENTVGLKDLASLCDIFYIGGTKCGAMMGEALVVPDPALLPNFFTVMKQEGSVLAKGRLLGIQFDTLFTDGLYMNVGKSAIILADKIRSALVSAGYKLYLNSPTNQIFTIIEDEKLEALSKKVSFSFWEKYDDTHTLIRFVTNWATRESDVDKLIEVIRNLN